MSPPHEEGRPSGQAGSDLLQDDLTTATEDQVTAERTALISSQQVAWWEVLDYVGPTLAQVGSWPTVGTPAWCLLAEGDPCKLAALYDAAQHWALTLESSQEAMCDASKAISQAADWLVIAQRSFVRTCFYEAHPWLKRSVRK